MEQSRGYPNRSPGGDFLCLRVSGVCEIDRLSRGDVLQTGGHAAREAEALLDTSRQIRELLQGSEGHSDQGIRNRSLKLCLELAQVRVEGKEVVGCDR